MNGDNMYPPAEGRKAIYIHGPDQWRYVETKDGTYLCYEYHPLTGNWEAEEGSITQEEAKRQIRDFVYSDAYNVNERPQRDGHRSRHNFVAMWAGRGYGHGHEVRTFMQWLES
jgi:hypothetical protein